jgi:hypothetical protein
LEKAQAFLTFVLTNNRIVQMKKRIRLSLFLILFSFTQGFSQNPPIAFNDTTITFRGHVIVNVLKNDSSVTGNPIRISQCHQPQHGTAFQLNDSIIEYHAYSSFQGLDSLRYVIQDSILHQLTASATLILTVTNSLMLDSVDANNISAGINANGLLFNEMFPDYRNIFEAPKGSGKNTIFTSVPWIAGLDSIDSLHLAAERYEQIGYDYWPGPVSNVYDTAYDYKFKRVWKISKQEIDYHLAHWWQSGYVPVQALTDWPGNGDTTLGQSAVLAPFKDWNNDGTYDPYAGDYPLIKGDEAVYFICNDVRLPHAESGGNKLGLEIHGMAYEFNCPDDSALWNTVFLNYKIYNRSQNTYHDSYIGMYTDLDIGDYYDDYIECDVQRGSFYAYNGDNSDGNGTLNTYGNFPPAQSVTFLAGPYIDPDGTDNPSGLCDAGISGYNFGNGAVDDERFGLSKFIYFNDTGPSYQTAPAAPSDYYNYLQGKWKDGVQMQYGGNGYTGAGAYGPECNFIFPGNSDSCNWGTGGIAPNGDHYWTESTVGNAPADRRGIGSMGPFTFEAGSMDEIDMAFVFGRDFTDTNATAAIPVIQQRIDSIKKYFVNDSTPCGLSFSSVQQIIRPKPQINIFPNPASSYVLIETSGMTGNMSYEIFDIVGRKIKNGTLNFTSKNVIDVSSIGKGLYLLNISDSMNKFSRKFIKQ